MPGNFHFSLHLSLEICLHPANIRLARNGGGEEMLWNRTSDTIPENSAGNSNPEAYLGVYIYNVGKQTDKNIT